MLYAMRRTILFILFFIGIFHSESFGQDSQNMNLLRFKVDSDVLYEHYANNQLELNRIRALIEKHAEDLFFNKGHFQLVAYIPKEKKEDPVLLGQATHCATVLRGWMRSQNPSLAKMTCAFSVSASDSSHLEMAVNYFPVPLDRNTLQLPLAPTVEMTRQALPLASNVKTITIIPDFIIYFRVDKSYIDPTYMNNEKVLHWISRIVNERNIAYIDSLVISAYASPEAPSDYNKRLSERRAKAVRNYLLKQFPLLKSEIVHAHGNGENWKGLRQLVKEDTQLPMQEEVLRIIDSNLPEDARELKLKALQGGAIYRYIYRNYYPRLRLGASLNVMLSETAPEDLRALIFGPGIQPPVIPILLPTIPLPVIPLRKEKERYPLALRTNLLYDAIGALNIGVELPLGKEKNWSLIADMAYSYWHSSNNRFALQTLEYGLESRYWFGVNQARKARNSNWAQPLKGFYLGAYGSYWQRYDVQFIDGYQGDDSWSAGLTAGYAIPIGRSLSFDLGIGAGWFSTSEYRHYHKPEYDEHGKHHLMWQQTGIWGGLSLTKLRLSLVWMFQTTKKQKGGDSR